MITALQTSVSGMMRASQRATDAAAAIVRAPVERQAAETPAASVAPSTDMSSEITAIVELSVAAQSYKANATAVSVANDMMGTLLDSIS